MSPAFHLGASRQKQDGAPVLKLSVVTTAVAFVGRITSSHDKLNLSCGHNAREYARPKGAPDGCHGGLLCPRGTYLQPPSYLYTVLTQGLHNLHGCGTPIGLAQSTSSRFVSAQTF